MEAIAGSEKPFSCDYLIAAIGQQVDKSSLSAEDGVQMDKWGCISVKPGPQTTTRAGVFAAGDCATGPSTLIHAMAGGLAAARNIDGYLQNGQVTFQPRSRMRKILNDNKILAGECLEVPVASRYRMITVS